MNGGRGSDYYRTPNLDALAARGTCFTSGYSSAPNCAPTRAALWSGRWVGRTGVYTVDSGNRGKAEFRKLAAAANVRTLDPEFVTLAERFAASGYQTGHFGKWHLGSDGTGAGPSQQGFHVAVGGNHRGGVGRDGHFSRPDRSFSLPGLGPRFASGHEPEREFLADRLTTEALAWMSTCTRPTFCCISHYSVHTPIQAPAAAIEAVGEPAEGARHRHRKYAAMMANLDANVGRVVEWLETTDDPVRPGRKRIENTLIVFTSDNGGLGGYREAGIAGGQEITTQRPLRSGKGSLHEGGVRVPYIFVWPGRVRAGATDPTPIQSLDLFPTLLAATGVEADPTVLEQLTDGADLSARLRPEPGAVAERPPVLALPRLPPGQQQARHVADHTGIRHSPRPPQARLVVRDRELVAVRPRRRHRRSARPRRGPPRRRARTSARCSSDWLRATKAPLPSHLDGTTCPLPRV